MVPDVSPDRSTRPVYSDVPSLDELRRSYRAISCYESQSGILWASSFAINARVLSEGFPFRPLPRHDYIRPPHDGLLNYEGNRLYDGIPWAHGVLEPYLGPPQGFPFAQFLRAYRTIATKPDVQGDGADRP